MNTGRFVGASVAVWVVRVLLNGTFYSKVFWLAVGASGGCASWNIQTKHRGTCCGRPHLRDRLHSFSQRLAMRSVVG